MSYVTGTTHYDLPQTVSTDKRDWADTNQAFADIDAAIYGAVSDVATAGSDISGIKSRLDTDEGNISTNAGNITNLDTRLTTAEGAISTNHSDIADVRSDMEDMICAYNEPTATSTHAYSVGEYFIYNDVLYRATASISIGDTIVPDTNCATTNVASELETLFGGKATLVNYSGSAAGRTWGTAFSRLIEYIDPTAASNVEYLLVMNNSGARTFYREVMRAADRFTFVANTTQTYPTGANTYQYRFESFTFDYFYNSYASEYVTMVRDTGVRTTRTGELTPENFTNEIYTSNSWGDSSTLELWKIEH